MNGKEKIKKEGDKVSSFVQEKGHSNDEVKKDIENLISILEENEKSSNYGDAVDATVKTVTAVAKSIDNFRSGDPKLITIGVLDTLAEVSQYAALTGPQGAIVAAVVGPLCSLISSFLSAGTDTGEPPESEEDMLKRVVTEALAVATHHDLQSEAAGVSEDLSDRVRTVNFFLRKGDKLGSKSRDLLLHDQYKHAGNKFLASLAYYITDGMGKHDANDAKRTAKLIITYTSIAYVRIMYLQKLSIMIGGDPEAKDNAEIVQQEADDQIKDAKKLLEPLLGRPDSRNYVVFSEVFLQPRSTLSTMEGICRKDSEGRLMAVYSCEHRNYLQMYEDKARTRLCQRFYALPDSQKFIVFGSFDSRVEIFSVDTHGYMYTNNHKPRDDQRRRVYFWDSIEKIPERLWHTEADRTGTVRLKNTIFDEYLYSDNFEASGGNNPVYTWRPKHKYGSWIFEEIRCPGVTKRIRSVSSDNLLNGRDVKDTGNDTIKLSKFDFQHEFYFDWELIKLKDDIYIIRSQSSNMYLNGRDKGIGDGPHVGLYHMRYDVARDWKFNKWRITEHDYAGKKCYAIQGVISGLYLDGRGPKDVGVKKLFLTGRDPKGDKYLMWDLLDPEEV